MVKAYCLLTLVNAGNNHRKRSLQDWFKSHESALSVSAAVPSVLRLQGPRRLRQVSTTALTSVFPHNYERDFTFETSTLSETFPGSSVTF